MPEARLADLLAYPSFARFLLARLVGTMAHQMLLVAISWHMYAITSSAWDLGMVGLFQFVPALLMTLPAGHLADRMHRGRIFATCMFAQAALAAVLVLAAWQGFASRELMFLVSVVLGITRAFQMPAQQAFTPLLVPAPLLQRAIAVSTSGTQAAIIAGPAIGGLLYSVGATVVYLCGATFLLFAGMLTLLVRYTHQRVSSAAGWNTVMAGVVFVWRRKVLLGATSLDLFAVLLGGATALLPIYARDILHTGPVGLGLLRGAPAIGALLMSVILARFPLERHIGYRLLGAVACFGIATLVFGLSRSFWLSMFALGVTGAADNISVVTRLTLVQLETPDEMRGRVAAVNGLFIGASNQLGEFESGVTASLFGAVGSVVLGGMGTMLVAASWLKLFPALAKRDRMG